VRAGLAALLGRISSIGGEEPNDLDVNARRVESYAWLTQSIDQLAGVGDGSITLGDE
jgi:hypothetical protein